MHEYVWDSVIIVIIISFSFYPFAQLWAYGCKSMFKSLEYWIYLWIFPTLKRIGNQ